MSETTVEVSTSASSCEFMSCPYFNNCTISIIVNGVAKNERTSGNQFILFYFVQFLQLPFGNNKTCLFTSVIVPLLVKLG